MDDPVLIMVINESGNGAVISPDEKGWKVIYAKILSEPGQWHLLLGERVALSMNVLPGEEPYYVRRTVGEVFVVGDRKFEEHAHGIGKRLTDGTYMRLWVFDDGQVCGGDDIDRFAQLRIRAAKVRAASEAGHAGTGPRPTPVGPGSAPGDGPADGGPHQVS